MKKKLKYMIIITAAISVCGCGSSSVPSELTMDVAESEAKVESEASTVEKTEEAVSEEAAEGKEPEEKSEGSSQTDTDVISDIEPEYVPLDPDASPGMLWEYTGYVDEADSYYWRDDFIGADYDEDGKRDRLYREYDADKELGRYTIEFGNARKIFVDGPFTGFPHITGADTDGDGENEILFTLTYDTSTDPFAFGNVWLFDLDEGVDSYREEELPFGRNEDDARTVKADINREGNKVMIKVPELDIEEEIELDEYQIESGWYDDLNGTCDRVICISEIHNVGGKETLVCYFEPMMKTGTLVGFELTYKGNEGYVPENAVYDARPDQSGL